MNICEYIKIEKWFYNYWHTDFKIHRSNLHWSFSLEDDFQRGSRISIQESHQITYCMKDQRQSGEQEDSSTHFLSFSPLTTFWVWMSLLLGVQHTKRGQLNLVVMSRQWSCQSILVYYRIDHYFRGLRFAENEDDTVVNECCHWSDWNEGLEPQDWIDYFRSTLPHFRRNDSR